MNIIKSKLLIFGLFYISANLFAAKILISGKPVILIPDVTYYRFPSGYVQSNYTYHYVYVAGERRVCFLTPRPELARLDMIRMALQEESGKRFTWFCYRYDQHFFEVDY